jgi:hypothetical protein
MDGRLPIPTPSADCSDLGTGRIEVSIAEDGQIMLAFLARDGEYRWWKMPAVNAIELAAALAARAASAIKSDEGNL